MSAPPTAHRTSGRASGLESPTHLDGNPLGRERLCSALLAIDRRFSSIKPRHPAGGPDGGIDLEATFQGGTAEAVAAGFLNKVADTRGQITGIKNKFKQDLAKAAAHR